ncbi:MAG: HAMP domain-containing protein [Anaerolineales bacterium]|nr:MAG: HAMP domain-containing protein [Anaerolineales bacterium]
MTLDFWGFSGSPSIGLPLRPSGYFLLLGEIALLLAFFFVRQDWAKVRRQVEGWIREPSFLLLLLSAPLAAQLFMLRLPTPSMLVIPGVPQGVEGPAFSIFGAFPWLLAAGFLGGGPAVVIAFMGGLARSAWETHSILTPLHMALAAALVSWLLRQNYREWLGRIGRNPLIAALIGGLVLGTLGSVEHYIYSGGTFYDAFDFTFSLLQPTYLATLIEMGIAGGICLWLRNTKRIPWHSPQRLIVGPYNRSLAARLLSLLVVVGVISSSVLLFGDWVLAQQAAQDLIEQQMLQTSDQVSSTIPYFIQTGRSIETHIAEELSPAVENKSVSEEQMKSFVRTIAFFRTLAVFDREMNQLAVYPAEGILSEGTPFELGAALDAALLGVSEEVVLRPDREAASARLAFITPIRSLESNQPIGAVVGVTDLDTNPYLLPVIEIIQELTPGQAFIIDANGTILVHKDPRRLMLTFEGSDDGINQAVLETAPDGTRRLVNMTEVRGYPWRVVVTVAQSEVQKLALQIAANLFVVVLAVGGVMLLAVYLISRRLTQPLRMMASVAQSIARGNLAQPVKGEGQDEIGRLAVSFERMRRRLKARLDEMGLLLTASQQVASSFNLDESLPPILTGIRDLTRSDFVHLALGPDEAVNFRMETFTAGDDPGNWSALDAQILELCETSGRFTLENPTRAKAVLDIQSLDVPLEAMTAVPLQNEDVFVGVLWMGYRQPQVFTPDTLRLLSILSGQLAIAVVNARLYQQAEKERLQLTAVLETTPDAVFLIDTDGRISLANPAAEAVLKRTPDEALGELVEECIESQELLDLLAESEPESRSVEIRLDQGQIMFASVSDIHSPDEGTSGRVCVLWDITHYKKLDTLKSEFVSTVSHDLRAPLTLMRGYATMLSMVGAMNEQQKEFISKILTSADQMGELIGNLLDLGRIEAGVGLEVETISLGTIIDSVMDTYRPQAVNKQITMDVELEEEMEQVEVDATLIRQAIANLVDNALKYTPADGHVTIHAEQQEEFQIVQVKDNGMGIAPTDQARLFEKFYRARGREILNIKGSGLGLAIAKSIVQQHGGRVAVESKLGEGSTFTIWFPIRQPDESEEAAVE